MLNASYFATYPFILIKDFFVLCKNDLLVIVTEINVTIFLIVSLFLVNFLNLSFDYTFPIAIDFFVIF